MCRRVQCKTCGKAGWAGCGAHVEQVLAGVPTSDRCSCREHHVTDRSTTATRRPSLLARLLGR